MAVFRDINQDDILNDLIDDNSIKSSVKNIVLTPIGTIPGFPEFGCNISGLIFEQMSMFTINNAKSIIINALNKWENRITNINVNIIKNLDYRSIECNIDYTIKQYNEQDSISFKLK